MNSRSLSILFRRPHRILKIFSTMSLRRTSQIHTLQVVPMKTTTNNNNYITFFFRKQQNMYYSTLNPNEDLIHLSRFLLLPAGSTQESLTTLDSMAPVIDRLIRFKSIESILLDLKSIGLFNDSNTNNSVSFLRLLLLLCLTAKHDEVIDAYHHMVKSHGFVPNTLASNILIDSLFSTHQYLAATSVISEMNSCDFYTYNVTLLHLCDKMDIPHLSEFLGLMFMEPYYPDDVTFNKVLESICKLNDYNHKIDVMPQVYQLLGLKVKLGIELSTNGWTSIIHKCCELGRLHDAANFFFNMIQTDCSSSVVPLTHTVLFKAFLDSNKVDDAFHLFNAMLSEGFKPDKHSFAKLVTALCAGGRMDEAVGAYRDIVMKHPHSDVHLDSQIPIMIMTELINSGMNDKAATLFTLTNGSLKVGEL